MIRWRKVGAVAFFELFSEIKRPSYLIVTFGMPVFVLAYAGLITTITGFARKSESAVRIYGVVDRAGALRLESDVTAAPEEIPPDIRRALDTMASVQGPAAQAAAWLGNVIFRPCADDAAAMAALQERSIRGWFLVDADYMQTGKVDSYFPEWAPLNTKNAERALSNLLQERLLAGRVTEDMAARIREPMREGSSWTLTGEGKLVKRSMISTIARLAIPFVFAFLLFISVFITSMSLIQGTAVEKENKVVEVLLSSASPDEILTGKLLGLGTSGLLQITVWFGMAGVAGLLFAGVLSAMGIEILWGSIVAGLCFFVAGYLFLGSLMLGTGSLGSNAKEGQQWSIIWTMLAVMPMVFLGILIEEPHGTLARVLTWIPFSSPTVVVLRLSLDADRIAWWEIVGSFLVLAASTWFALRLGARLFRVGLLLSGGRPGLREIIRQARL